MKRTLFPLKTRNRSTKTAAASRSNSSTKVLVDAEFGDIALKRHANARYVRLRMEESGSLSVTLPRFASRRHAEELVESSREQIRSWQLKHKRQSIQLNDGDRVGQSHVIWFTPAPVTETTVKITNLVITVTYPETLFHTDIRVQQALQPHLQKALQKEARAYLPRRLAHLARMYGFHYKKIRYGTQKGRWGSCSSSGTISLNVGLMLLDLELIDYVLVHELCHTKHMNHSADFWRLVESCLPNYKARRALLKTKQPTL